MVGLNHALTGIAIAVMVKNPVLAPVIALASHFVLDALPHFGHPKLTPGTKAFRWYLLADAALMVAATLTAMLLFSAHWFLVGLCAFMAFAPDVLWYFTDYRPRRSTAKWLQSYTTFAKIIQWYERPLGAVIEAIYAVVIVVFISTLFVAK